QVRDLRADGRQQPLAILDFHRQLDGVPRGGVDAGRLVPFDLDATLGVVQQVDDVGTRRRVDGHALAARDVADDLLAADRIAAARAEDHQVVEAADLDLLFAAAEHAPDDGDDRSVRRLLAQLVVGDELDEHLLRLQLAVSDGRVELVGLLRAELVERRGELGAVDDRLEIEVVAPRFLLEQLPSELRRAHLLFTPDPVLDLVSRVRSDDEVQPVAARTVAVLRDDLDDVAVFELAAERHHLAVDA